MPRRAALVQATLPCGAPRFRQSRDGSVCTVPGDLRQMRSVESQLLGHGHACSMHCRARSGVNVRRLSNLTEKGIIARVTVIRFCEVRNRRKWFLAMALFVLIIAIQIKYLFRAPTIDAALAYRLLRACSSQESRRCYIKGSLDKKSAISARWTDAKPYLFSDASEVSYYKFRSQDKSVCAYVEFYDKSLRDFQYSVEIYNCSQENEIKLGIG